MATQTEERIIALKEFQKSEGYQQINPGYSNKYISLPDDKLLCKVCVVTKDNPPTGHRHTTSDSIHVILEGEGEAITDSGRRPMKAGDLIYTKADELHGFRSTTDKPLWFLSIEGPMPLDLLGPDRDLRGVLNAAGHRISD